MEKLDFRFNQEDFGDIPTLDFHGFQEKPAENLPPTTREIFYKEEKRKEPTENLEFTLNANKENRNENGLKSETMKNVISNLNFSKGAPKKLQKLKTNKPSDKQKSKFKKPFQKQKAVKNTKEDWNDDVRATDLLKKVPSLKVSEEKIKERNKEQIEKKVSIAKSKEAIEREKYKTYQNPSQLEESFSRSRDAKQKKQSAKKVQFKKEKIKEIEKMIDEEQKKQNIIYERFSKNLKTFQTQKSNSQLQKSSLKPGKSKIKIYDPPSSDNLLEIDNYSPPKSFQADDPNLLNHEDFEKQLQKKKANLYFNSKKANQDYDIDEIPTKENGETKNTISSQKKARKLLESSSFKPINPSKNPNNKDLVSQIESQEKERLLEEMIQKHKEEIIKKKGGFIPTEYTKQINRKIAQIKNDMEPILSTLSKRNQELSEYPFTHNLLSNACSKLICVNSEKITEMIVDDILVEMVGILNEMEENEKTQEENENRENIIYDFMEALKDLQCEQDQIVNQRSELIRTGNQIHEIKNDDLLMKKLEKKNYYRILELTEKTADKILKDKLELDSLMNAKSLSDKRMVAKIKEAGEILIDQISREVFEEFLQAQEEFVEKIYEQEFFSR